jgi:dolichol-phosphate mannosyltransferase
LNWSVIIFCYNERDNVAKVIEGVYEFLKVNNVAQYEVIVVDDGSTDGTKQEIEKFAQIKPNFFFVNHKENKGIGLALRSGYDKAKMEYICAVPGDNQFDVSELSKVKPFSNLTFYSFYRTNMYKSWYRKLIHLLNKAFNKFLLGMSIRDVNWIKVYRKEQLDSVSYQLESSIIESEICAKLYKMGVRPIEFPSKYLPRDYGYPKGGTWKTIKMAVWETLSLYKVVRNFRK